MKSLIRVLGLVLFSTFVVVFLVLSLAVDGDDDALSDLFSFNPFRGQTKPSLVKDPPLPRDDKIVVIGKLSNEDTSWVESDLPDWQSAVYVVNNDSAPLHTPMNKGREALAYLTYLIDNYDNLPRLIAFVHSHKEGYPQAWHTDAHRHSNVLSLQGLRPSSVLNNGYVNLRCNPEPGCPEWMKPHEGRGDPIGEREMPGAFMALFGQSKELPREIAQACCAQFAVSRDQVLKRPREDYVRFRQWTMDSELSDQVLGRIWEYLWHIVFGMDPVYCPSYRQCSCRVYGRMCSKGFLGTE